MAGRKRKAEAARVLEDEADRPLYSAFRGAANSLTQLHALAGAHQRLSFHAGERHAMEILYKWILRQNENGHEIEYGGEDPLVSPRSQCTVQSFQASMHISNTSNQQASPSLHAQAIPGLQPKNSMVFCSALSSPVRQSLQPYHLQQDGRTGHSADGILCTGTHESNSAASNDSFMDMHSDNPAHES